MQDEIVIIGFPKCGTSALIRVFEHDPEVQVAYSPGGSREVSWPLIKDIYGSGHIDPDKIHAHKYSSYAYNSTALQYLVEANPKSILTLCLRDLRRVLISWHHMHQSNAKTGRLKSHFTWLERDFYASCTISEYYERFAEPRLQYDHLLTSILKTIPPERLAVMSQERMAQDIHAAAHYLKTLSRDGSEAPPPPDLAEAGAHAGYADKADIVLDKKIQKDLRAIQGRLNKMLSRSTAHKYL